MRWSRETFSRNFPHGLRVSVQEGTQIRPDRRDRVHYIIMILVRKYIPVPYARGVLTILFFGYWYSYLQNIITTTGYGDDSEPSLPEASYSDLIGPVIQMFATTALCFLPAVGLLIWQFFNPDTECWNVVAGGGSR